MTNVKQRIVETLNTVRQFRAELKTRERNLEASLLEIDALGVFLNQRSTCFYGNHLCSTLVYNFFDDETGERILGISQILNNKLV